jgi:fumarate hydratase class I
MFFFQGIIAGAFRRTRFTDVTTEKPQIRGGRLFIPPSLLQDLARESFGRLAFYLRESQLALWADRLQAPDASDNDRLVLSALLKNALVAAGGEFALCQDTGTALIYGWKDESVYTGVDDGEALARGAAAAYRENHLRASMVGAASFFDEFNTGNNLPAQTAVFAVPDGDAGPAYRFLFAAKGGGASNKTAFFSLTPAMLEKRSFDAFLEKQIRALGTAACPPYRLAVVAGGLSPEFNLEVLKLATTELLDGAPYFEEKNPAGDGPLLWRDRYWEDRILDLGRKTGLGAQFGGTSLILDARVLRLPRHAASCPVSIGVSCAAHRNLLAYIDARGLHLEKLAEDPEKFLKTRGLVFNTPGTAAPGDNKPGDARFSGKSSQDTAPRIRLDQPMGAVLAELSRFRPGDRVLLSGKILLARDAAHLKWHKLLERGEPLPDYLLAHPICYAGPSAAPPGKIIGSLGPTTAQRMDPYAEEFMSRGASLITVAKGGRSPGWAAACKKYRGFYLGIVGGAAALLAEEHITACELIDYPELGMEAVRLITLRNLSAFILIDDQGNSAEDRWTG